MALDLSTPPACTADFCLIPIGTPTASVSKEVAEVQKLMAKSGLKYSMHSAGTTLGMLEWKIASLSYSSAPSLSCFMRSKCCLESRADLDDRGFVGCRDEGYRPST